VLKELNSGNDVAFFLCSKISPILRSAKMTHDYAQFITMEKLVPMSLEKQQIDGCTQGKIEMEKIPPDNVADIGKNDTRLCSIYYHGKTGSIVIGKNK
jgi:hypothetical protein